MKHLNIAKTKLAGAHLIEADAGSGKTYATTELYLRLIADAGIPAGGIPVITFTEAAAAELKERIAAKMTERAEEYKEQERVRIDAALEEFDFAPIMTIHGFCLKILQEFYLECGVSPGLKAAPDISGDATEIADDFWIERMKNAGALFVRFASRTGFTPDALIDAALNWASDPALKFSGSAENADAILAESAEAEKNFREAVSEAIKNWQPNKIREAMSVLTKAGYKSGLDGLIKGMGEFIAASKTVVSPFLYEKTERFTPEKLKNGAAKGVYPPEHPFFNVCERLMQAEKALHSAFKKRCAMLYREFLAYARREIKTRIGRKNEAGFNELLALVYIAMKERPELAEELRKKYKAALIDEFQDTDPIQCAIFKMIFPDGPLFMVGDPKQSIYAFRGADVFAYINAAKTAENKWRLGKNYRASSGAIKAINAMFSRPEPFAAEGINFYPADAQDASPPEKGSVRMRITPSAGLINKPDAAAKIMNNMAADILRRIASGECRPEDIAVLTRKNAQARETERYFKKHGIPCAADAGRNPFKTDAARTIEIVLNAVSRPNDAPGARGALVTPLFGMPPDAAEKISDEELCEAMKSLRDKWTKSGLCALAREIHLDSLGSDAAEIIEHLQLKESEQNLNPRQTSRLLARLRAGIEPADSAGSKSAGGAVRIMTIHKAKGLEFDTVYLPFVWDGDAKAKKPGPFVYHSDGGRVLELGGENEAEHRFIAAEEEFQESLRLFYVAMTRAKKNCILYYANARGANASPLYYFLNPGDSGVEEAAKMKEQKSCGCFSVDEWDESEPIPMEDWRYLDEPEQSFFTADAVRRAREPGDMPLSFSAVSAPRERRPEDAVTEDGLPHGKAFGRMFHELMAGIDFTKPDTWEEKSGEKISVYGFDPALKERIAAMAANVVNAALAEGVSLKNIPHRDRAEEIRFTLPGIRFSSDDFNAALEKTHAPKITFHKPYAHPGGPIVGVIDLLFETADGKWYALDYKTNLLPGYSPGHISDAMEHGMYLLQGYLYCIAAHLHLTVYSQRGSYLYENNFGGMFFPFVRGLKDNREGLFFMRPSFETVAAVLETICGKA